MDLLIGSEVDAPVSSVSFCTGYALIVQKRMTVRTFKGIHSALNLQLVNHSLIQTLCSRPARVSHAINAPN